MAGSHSNRGQVNLPGGCVSKSRVQTLGTNRESTTQGAAQQKPGSWFHPGEQLSSRIWVLSSYPPLPFKAFLFQSNF